MCLGLPGQIVAMKSNREAVVDFWGLRKSVRLDNISEPALVGDYIIDHDGYAVRVIPVDDVADTLALYEVLLSEAGEDPIVRDLACDPDQILDIEIEEPAFA